MSRRRPARPAARMLRLSTSFLALLLWLVPAFAGVEMPATQPYGPDIVILDELVDKYKPVPFSHAGHAKMAEMWDGCRTCHHRDPEVTTSRSLHNNGTPVQDDAGKIPACKSCHPPASTVVDIHTPNLKGAYHRQCLNCHREWMHENACSICHEPLEPGGKLTVTSLPTPDDIVGRMHPPIEPPTERIYRTRFMTAVGNKVIFRHDEHTDRFGVKCASCHRHDNCANCHDPAQNVGTTTKRIIKPGKTWKASHEPCVNCHENDRCKTCHYHEDHEQPRPFDHQAVTGQALDDDHANLKCADCHAQLKTRLTPTCGDASCHDSGRMIAFPADRPGEIIPKQAKTRPLGLTLIAPTTAPTIRRVREGGS